MTTNDKTNEREEEERGTIGGEMMVKESSPKPRKLNDGMIESLSRCVSSGNYIQTAVAICGISEFAFYDWLKKAEVDEQASLDELSSPYIRLAKAIKKAEAEREALQVQRVIEATEGGAVVKRITREKRDGTIETEEEYSSPQWLASMTFLERRHPDRWGRKDRTQVEVTERKTIQITHEVIVKDYGQGHAIDVPQHTPGLPQPGDDEKQ